MKKRNNEELQRLLEKIGEHEYHYYYPYSVSILEEAIQMERNYLLNCSDFPKDFSTEARNKRFNHYIKLLKEKRKI